VKSSATPSIRLHLAVLCGRKRFARTWTTGKVVEKAIVIEIATGTGVIETETVTGQTEDMTATTAIGETAHVTVTEVIGTEAEIVTGIGGKTAKKGTKIPRIAAEAARTAAEAERTAAEAEGEDEMQVEAEVEGATKRDARLASKVRMARRRLTKMARTRADKNVKVAVHLMWLLGQPRQLLT